MAARATSRPALSTSTTSAPLIGTSAGSWSTRPCTAWARHGGTRANSRNIAVEEIGRDHRTRCTDDVVRVSGRCERRRRPAINRAARSGRKPSTIPGKDWARRSTGLGRRLAFRRLFGYCGSVSSSGATMLHVPDLERKLDTLIGLAVDDRDGAPPRLRHARDVGALGPVNIRELRARRRRAQSAAPYPDDERLQLQLRLLPDAAGPGDAAHPAQARGAGPDLPRRAPPRMGGRPVRHDRHPQQSGPGHGPAHRRAGAAARAARLRRIYPREARGGGRARRRSSGSPRSRAASRSTSRPRAARASPGSRPEKSLPVALENLERVRAIVLEERTARAHGRPVDALHPGGAAGMTTQFVVGATPDTDRTLLQTVSAAPGRRRHPSHALQRLPADHRHADGERGRRARAAGAPAVPGRLSAARLRLHRGRGGLRAVRKPAALGGPQGGLGAGASGAVSGGGHPRLLRGARTGAGHRTRIGAPAGDASGPS